MAFFLTSNKKRPTKKSDVARKDFYHQFMDQFFDNWDFATPTNFSEPSFTPTMDIKEEDDHYLLEAELPGIKKDDIKIDLKNDHLILSGEKRTFNEEKKDSYHHQERTYGSFYRSVAVPNDIDKEKISAKLDDGVLRLTLGKRDSATSENRKIDIR